jgi:hypothetical protein
MNAFESMSADAVAEAAMYLWEWEEEKDILTIDELSEGLMRMMHEAVSEEFSEEKEQIEHWITLYSSELQNRLCKAVGV